MIAFTSAIEPLRLANRAAGRALYEWRLYSADGAPVPASNGIEIGVGGSFVGARELERGDRLLRARRPASRPPRS